MSWSINLSGKTDAVKKELTHAAIEIAHALNALNEATTEEVNVSVGGHGNLSCWFNVYQIPASAPVEHVEEVAPETPAAEPPAEG